VRQPQKTPLRIGVAIEQVHLRTQAQTRQLAGQQMQMTTEVVGVHLGLQKEGLARHFLLVRQVGDQSRDQEPDGDHRGSQVDQKHGPGEAGVDGRQVLPSAGGGHGRVAAGAGARLRRRSFKRVTQ